MHAETLAYMLHQLPLHQKTGPAISADAAPRGAVEHDMVRVPAGSVTLGL